MNNYKWLKYTINLCSIIDLKFNPLTLKVQNSILPRFQFKNPCLIIIFDIFCQNYMSRNMPTA